MHTTLPMPAVRAWHRPVRLALVYAALAMAGGAPAVRAAYAEVSTPAVTQLLSPRAARAAERTPARCAAGAPPSLVATSRITLPPAPLVPARPLYLAHCALLL